MNEPPASAVGRLIGFCLQNKLIVFLGVLFFLGWGIVVAPFDWDIGERPMDPVPVDAIPDIGENQQIVFTEWMGRSPQDVEDQITYPLTTALLGVPSVKTVRSYSMFGFSTIYVIFKDGVEFYWSRSRVLEKLSSLSPGTLPEGVQPILGPDATALGQIFWYTLEGRNDKGEPTGGWDLDELRSVQDWTVRYALLSADGVSEVASVGGYVREYQIDVDPDALRAARVSLEEVFNAIKMSNVDVGARTIEVNRAEYVIRGIGFLKNMKDIEATVIKASDNVPIRVRDVAHVSEGPALRRGALDKEGAEAVGGVVVVRYGENPLKAIKNVKAKIAEISPALPKKVLADGTVSHVEIVPFYDRTGLIHETLGTLDSALTEEILVTIIIVIVMVMHLRSSILIAGLLPLAVLMTFSAMKIFHVDANIVALSGIAIAIGTMVDMGIVICENILRRLEEASPEEDRLAVVWSASTEVGSAVLTAVATTVVSFLPVFTMTAAEGKLFKPLAFTKTFALIASIVVALAVIPPAAHALFTFFTSRRTQLLPVRVRRWAVRMANGLAAAAVAYILARHWLPLGPDKGLFLNLLFVTAVVGGLLGFFLLFQRGYPAVLRWCLRHKIAFLAAPTVIVLVGGMVWLGFDTFFGWLPRGVRTSRPVSAIAHVFPGLGKEFMPSLDEGSFLYMPTTMPHASIGEALDVIQKQDIAITQIPEVESAVGKIGRAETPLDPAPISMIETVINYRPEYVSDESGRHRTFRHDPDATDLFRDEGGRPIPAADGKPYTVQGRYARDAQGLLVPEAGGKPFRLWRPALDPELNPGREAWAGVNRPDDIWDLIVQAAEVPGTTSAPRLQPIAARIVMLQSGMRAPMGIKIKGPDLDTIERVGLDIERLLKEVPSVEPSAVIADRIVGKPYLEIVIDREAIARYGIHLRAVQNVIEVAVGGKRITTTVEGRERYPVRVRYMRELRDNIESLGKILVAGGGGVQVPLGQLARIEYVRGPQVIKSEDTKLIGYVLFDMKHGKAEVDVVEQAKAYLEQQTRVFEKAFAAAAAGGRTPSPAEIDALPGLDLRGCNMTFAGSYENQIRAQRTLSWVLPLALFFIFIILYMQFRSTTMAFMVFSGVAVAWAGGFLMIWLYGQDWFLHFTVLGTPMRDLFQVHPLNLSVAVWVGFLALFGIATDDGVIMGTYLNQSFERHQPGDIAEIRRTVLESGTRRVRPCLMTTATTVIALLPVLTSDGRGSDIMLPMAVPAFGGMTVEILTMFVIPVLFCAVREFRLRTGMAPAKVGFLAVASLFTIPLFHGLVAEWRVRKHIAQTGSADRRQIE